MHREAEAEQPVPPQVILLGDSIRAGYQKVAIRELQGAAEVWAPEENCAHTAHTLARLDVWLQGKTPALIHINAGLHDMWINDDGTIRHSLETYSANLEAIFSRLKRVPGATIIFALTTPVDQQRQASSPGYGRIVRNNKDIPRYNAEVRRLARKHEILVNDLYAAVENAGTDRLIGQDGVHFNPAGYEVLGRAVAAKVRQCLAQRDGQ